MIASDIRSSSNSSGKNTNQNESSQRSLMFGFDEGFNSERFSDIVLLLCRSTSLSPFLPNKRLRIENVTAEAKEEHTIPLREAEEIEAVEEEVDQVTQDPCIQEQTLNEPKETNKRKRKWMCDEIAASQNETIIPTLATSNDDSQCEVMERLRVNSLLLASRSEFFKALFCNGMSESQQKEIRIVLDCDEKELFVAIIQFLYTGRLEITTNKLTDAIVVANKFAVTLAVFEAVKMLGESSMSIEKAEEFLDLSEIPGCEALVERAKKYLLRRFEEFEKEWYRAPFLGLGHKAVAVVLGSSELVVNSENTVLQALRSWVAKDKDDRQGHLAELFSLIRLPLLDSNFLKDVLLHSSLFTEKTIPGFSDMVMSAVEFRVLPSERQEYMQKEGLVKPCTPRIKPMSPSKVFTWDIPRSTALNGGATSNLFYCDGYYFITGLKAQTKEGQKLLTAFCLVDPTKTGLTDHFWLKPVVSMKLKNFDGPSLGFSSSNHALSKKHPAFRWCIPSAILQEIQEANSGFLSPEDGLRFEVTISLPEDKWPLTLGPQRLRQSGGY